MGIIDYIQAKQRERAMKEAWDVTKKVGLGLIVGTALGAAGGVLLAPQSGEETRKDIQKMAIEGKNTIEDKTQEIYEDLQSKYKEFAERNLTDIGVSEDEDGVELTLKLENEDKKDKE